jgi:hypothetical protein
MNNLLIWAIPNIAYLLRLWGIYQLDVVTE